MTILNQTEIVTANTPWAFVSGIAAIAFMIMIFVAFYEINSEFATKVFVVLFGVALFFFLLFANQILLPVDTGKNKYECTIEDGVSLSEITEKYNIVEQRGEIWVLEDKDDKRNQSKRIDKQRSNRTTQAIKE